MKKSQLISAILLPFTVTIIIPAILYIFTYRMFSWNIGLPLILLPLIAGLILIGAGIYLMIETNRLFYTTGKGTLAPWAPPKKLVIKGPYSYVRHPMIGAVLLILLGESVATGSLIIFGWFAAFLTGNIIYFINIEEPVLEKRFGDEYRKYKNDVPMFIPKPRRKR